MSDDRHRSSNWRRAEFLYELFEPELFDANDPSHLARWMRLAFEAYLDEA